MFFGHFEVEGGFVAHHGHHRHRFGASGNDAVSHARVHPGRGDVDGLYPGAAVAVHDHAGHLFAQCHQRDHAAHLHALLGFGHGVAHDHIVDHFGGEPFYILH